MSWLGANQQVIMHHAVPQVHYNHDLTHGEFLIKAEVKQAVIEEVKQMLRRGGSAVVGLARPVLNTTVTLACTD